MKLHGNVITHPCIQCKLRQNRAECINTSKFYVINGKYLNTRTGEIEVKIITNSFPPDVEGKICLAFMDKKYGHR